MINLIVVLQILASLSCLRGLFFHVVSLKDPGPLWVSFDSGMFYVLGRPRLPHLLSMTLDLPIASVTASFMLYFILVQLSFNSSMSFVCYSFIFSLCLFWYISLVQLFYSVSTFNFSKVMSSTRCIDDYF